LPREIKPGSRISKLPKFLIFPALFIRDTVLKNFVRKLPYTPNRYYYHHDGVATFNSSAFMQGDRFKIAYSALVSAYKWDPDLPWRVHQIIWSVDQVLNLDGVFVECGVGRGGLMASLTSSISDWNLRNEKMFLFDTFESNTIYSKSGQKISTEKPNKYYAVSIEETRANFTQYDNITFVPGSVLETVSPGLCGKIKFLSIDLNNSEAEEHVFRTFYPDVVPGGIIVLDDYYAAGRDRQRLLMDKMAIELNFNILATPSGQGIVVKR